MRKIISVCILLLLWSSFVQGQKVALVLSGGGAKGIAHLGVIKALEEHHIPIDYIIGTSMGGIIGGFYAAGYSIEQMEEIVRSENFQDWVSGNLSDNYRYFLYKEEQEASMLSLRIAMDSLLNVSLKSSSLISDNVLNFTLTELLARASATANCDFDSLMIPFRCLAADIFTQETIVIDNGNLNEAIRATLSVPFFFSATRFNGKYVFDGGLYNNFPVDIAEATFQPDIIIGSNVSSKTYTEYPFEKDEELIKRSLFYLLLSKSDSTQINEKGIYIQPNLKGYSALNFKPVDSLLEIGYRGTLEKINVIREKIPSRRTQKMVHTRREKFKSELPAFRLGSICISGANTPTKKYLKNMLHHKPENLTLENIKKKYFRLAEADKFEVLYPTFVYNPVKKVFDFELKVKPDKNLKAKIGGNLASRSISQLFLGVQYDYINKLLYSLKGNFYSGQFYVSTDWKARVHIPTKVPVYLEPYFTFNRWNYANIGEIFFKNSREETILIQNDTQIGINMGIAAGRKAKFVIKGVSFNNHDRYTNTQLGALDDELDHTQFVGVGTSVEYAQNTLNRRLFASEGYTLQLKVQYLDGEEVLFPGTNSLYDNKISRWHRWFKGKFRFEKYMNFGKYTFGYQVEGLVSNQNLFQNYTSTMIVSPAFYPLVDSKSLFLKNFRAFNYGAVGIKNSIQIRHYIDFRLEGYAFGAYRPLIEVEPQVPMTKKEKIDVHFAASAGVIYHTMLGPISFHLNYYDDDAYRWGGLFNIGFLLYNLRFR